MAQKSLPVGQNECLQLDLWKDYLTNDIREVSNSIEMWDSIPKYFLNEKNVKRLRNEDGFAEPFEWIYTHNDHEYMIIIQPAQIKNKAGQYKAYFPSVTEELIEQALRKILTDQNLIFHDVKQYETWIKFTLKGLQKELVARGKSRSLSEIKHSIDVLSKCNITVFKDHKEVWRGAILQDLITVNRDEYLENSNAYHAAKLPVFISHGINYLDYRQFNYDRLMNIKDQLSRWIYRLLIHRHIQANTQNSYHFKFSRLKSSGLLQMTRERDNRKKVHAALDELVNRKVLSSYKVEEKREGRRILDEKYTVTPSYYFETEQKAANKRISENESKAIRSGNRHLRAVGIKKQDARKLGQKFTSELLD